MKTFLSILLAAVAVGGYTQLNNQLPSPNQSVRYSMVAQGPSSSIKTQETVVISDEATWTKYYGRMIDAKAGERVAAPRLCDFTRQDLLVIHVGQRPTAGYSVFVNMVRPEAAIAVAVDFTELRPPTNAVLTQQLTSPYCVVAVDRQSLGYKFRGQWAISNFVPNSNNHDSCKCGCPYCCGGASYRSTINTTGNFPVDICPPKPQRGGGRNGG